MIVVDNSVFLAWCMRDEDNSMVLEVMRRVAEEGGVVPQIWWYEFRNALLTNERRNRISSPQASKILTVASALKVEVDKDHGELQLFDFARRFELTIYDAAYLEVASRRDLPLATLDRRMREAADAAGIITA